MRRKVTLIFRLLLLLLCFFYPENVRADSKKGFQKINSEDFKYFLNTGNAAGKPFIYIFSSASVLKEPKDSTSYSLTNKEIPYISPASKVAIFPEISTLTRSEYFDFTIWGHLGNYFNQNAEIIELENEVIEIFNTLESINEKYRVISPDPLSMDFKKEYTITADRNNFFSITTSSKKSGENSKNQPAKQNGNKAEKNLTSPKKELLKLRTLKNPVQIKLNKAIVMKHNKNLKEDMQALDNRIAEELLSTPTQTLRQVEPDSDTFMNKIIYFFTAAPGFIKNNPLESFIYIMFIYFFLKILTMIFLRK